MNKLFFSFLFAGIQFLPLSVHSQMFSVGDAPKRTFIPSSFIRIGFGPTTFDFEGTTSEINSELLEVNDRSFYLNFETPGVSLSLVLANALTGLDNQSFFDLGITLSNNFNLVRRQAIQIGIPIQLYTSITNSRNDRIRENFSQVNFAFGAGGFINLRFSQRIVFSNSFVPGYGFSNSNGGFFGGSMFYLKGKSRLNFINLIGNRSVSIGYDFNHRSFDIDEDFYDFDLTSHLITLGISL